MVGLDFAYIGLIIGKMTNGIDTVTKALWVYDRFVIIYLFLWFVTLLM